jgi:tRNA threonylcarbamoyladenosine biosynthesis protein TsaE
MIIEVTSEMEMKLFGAKLGRLLVGGECIELVGDVGAGKTTLVKGVARGLEIEETIQSPSFTISRVYDTPHELRLAHYDFYRLHDAGIMADELQEASQDSRTITIIEWAGIVSGVLPDDHMTITITAISESERRLELAGYGASSQQLVEQLA